MSWNPWDGDPICENCKWWASHGDTGHCHRYPPQLSIYINRKGGAVAQTEWPTTSAEDSCGEWDKREDVA